jgi:hypothetical protein
MLTQSLYFDAVPSLLAADAESDPPSLWPEFRRNLVSAGPDN